MISERKNPSLDTLNKQRIKKCSKSDLVAKDVLKNELREYQEEALLNYLMVAGWLPTGATADVVDDFDPQRHCFHMATGSGKTMLMAYLIAHAYSQGFRKVLFLTNSTTLIDKTQNNLVPAIRSSKCEFKYNSAGAISISDMPVMIRPVSTFSEDINDIEICFSTIQDLHLKLENPVENGVTLEDLSKLKILVIGDEAHHFNASTKDKPSVIADTQTWESTIAKIINVNSSNKLIEFSATIDLRLESVFNKYVETPSRIVYDFTLAEFRKKGYSKEIELVQILSKRDRIAKAILANYSKYLIATDNGVPLLPKILFKSSGAIADLDAHIDEVASVINAIDEFDPCLSPAQCSQINMLYNKSTCIKVHSKDKNKATALQIVNNLDSNLSINMVFAIDMLNEGWDVLSLTDIVKLDDTRVNASVAEAQLIGRGARIFPYSLQGDSKSFTRRFDGDTSNPLRQLESLHFYSSDDSGYIKNIKSQLISDGLMDDQSSKNVVIRPKADKVSKYGNYYVFTNKLIDVSPDNILEKLPEVKVSLVFNPRTQSASNNFKDTGRSLVTIATNDIFGTQAHLFVKALNRCVIDIRPLLDHTNLSSHDLLKSLFTSDKYSLESDIEYERLEYSQRLLLISRLVTSVMSVLSKLIHSGKIGSTSFNQEQLIKNVFGEYSTNVSKVKLLDTKEQLVNSDIYYHDQLTADSNLEINLHEDVFSRLDSSKYVVIRNEGKLKFFSPLASNAGEGFEPDFIVLMDKSSSDIALFYLEVKGSDRVDSQSWKQDILDQLNKGNPISVNSVDYRLEGFDFYTDLNKIQWVNNHVINGNLK